MPKVKTNSSAKKRFKISGSGKIVRKKAYKRAEKELQIILEMDPLNEKAGKKLSELPKLH